MTLKIIKTGTWLYDSVEKSVDVVGLNYDWWYELSKADNLLGKDDAPLCLGKEGYLYYARFRHAGEHIEPTWVDTDGYQTLLDAMQAAEKKVEGGIKWQ